LGDRGRGIFERRGREGFAEGAKEDKRKYKKEFKKTKKLFDEFIFFRLPNSLCF
jgi:hypothetical protein